MCALYPTLFWRKNGSEVPPTGCVILSPMGDTVTYRFSSTRHCCLCRKNWQQRLPCAYARLVVAEPLRTVSGKGCFPRPVQLPIFCFARRTKFSSGRPYTGPLKPPTLSVVAGRIPAQTRAQKTFLHVRLLYHSPRGVDTFIPAVWRYFSGVFLSVGFALHQGGVVYK